MTLATENPLFAGMGEKQIQRVEWSRLAARRAKEYHHQWQGLARTLSRNPELKLEFTGGTPRTDGNTVWLRIPIELGDPTPHVRNGVCNKRDENDVQRCPACKVLEDVETTMYHEIFHITMRSFAEMTDAQQVQILKDAFRLEAGSAPEGSRMRKLEAAIKKADTRSFVVASKLISKWFGILLNVAEDGRVNKMGMEARPGVRKMFKAQTYSIFVNGIQRADGTIVKWSEQPANMQALIMLYCKIFQLDYTGWFDERIIADLDDYRINRYCERLAACRAVEDTYRLCIPVLERLRELGYCKSPEDPEDDPQPESEKSEEKQDQPQGAPADEDSPGAGGSGESQEPDQDDESDEGTNSGSQDTGDEDNGPETAGKDDESEGDESSSGGEGEQDEEGDEEAGDDSGPGDTEPSDEQDEEDSDSADGEAGDGESTGEQPDEDFKGEGPESYEDLDYGTPEESEDGFNKFGRHEPDGQVTSNDTERDREEVERAIAQEEHFDAPSVNVWGVQIHENESEGLAWTEQPYSYRHTTDPIVIPETILAPALAKLRVVFTDNKKGAHERNLTAGSRINQRWLGQRVPAEDYRIFERKIKPGKKDWFVLVGLDVSGSTDRGRKLELIKESAHAMADLLNRLGVGFAVYAHTGASSDHPQGNMDLDIYVVKSPEQRWDTDAKRRLCALQPSSANLDGHTLEFYRKIVERRRETDRLVLYYTDGAMPCANFEEELIILQREIDNLKRMRVGIVGVGIQSDSPTQHGLDTIRMDQIHEVPRVVAELERRLQG